MQTTLRRLASASEALPLTVSQASIQLIPPIPLYRRILRAHRHLPIEMRFMGDSYVKSEFRLTRTTDNPLHIIAFLSQWKMYLDEIEPHLTPGGTEVVEGLGAGDSRNLESWRGKKLDTALMDRLSDEQVGQLYELMHATKDVWKSREQLEKEAEQAGVGAGVDGGKIEPKS